MSDDTWAGLADQFVDEAYASVKGYVRTYVMHQQLLEHLPAPPAPVLDVGGGAGHQSFPLAQAGYDVTLLDPSPAMLDKARQRLQRLPGEAQRRVTLLAGRRRERRRGGGRPTLRRRVVPWRARVPRAAGAAGQPAVPVRRRRRHGLDHDGQRQGDGGAPGLGTAVGRRPGGVRRQDRDRGAGSAGPGRHGGGTQRARAEPRAWSHCAGTGYGCSSTGSSSAEPSWTPAIHKQVAATAAVELEASRRDPYRQLSRVFHLVGRKGPG